MGLVPSVNVNVVEQTRLVNDVAFSDALIIGEADWGPIGELRELSGFSELANLYKSGSVVDEGFFYALGGGKNVKVYRVATPTAAKATFTFNDAGSTPTLQIDALYEGTYGNNISVLIEDVAGNVKLTISDGQIVEIYDNLGDGYSSNSDIVNDINNNSQLVRATDLGGALVAPASKTFLSGGDSGTGVADADYINVLDVLDQDEFNFLLVPGKTDDAFHASMVAAVESRYSIHKKNTIYVSGISLNEDINTTKTRTAYSSDGRFILVAPGYMELDGRVYDGSYVAAIFAGLFSSLTNSESPTHKAIPDQNIYVDFTSNKKYYSLQEQEILLQKGIVPLSKIANYFGVVRAVTRVSDISRPVYEASVRRIVDFLETSLRNLLVGFIGQPNLEEKRTVIKNVVETFLDIQRRDTLITEYAVDVSQGLNPDEVNVNISIKPVFAINFINITLTI